MTNKNLFLFYLDPPGAIPRPGFEIFLIKIWWVMPASDGDLTQLWLEPRALIIGIWILPLTKQYLGSTEITWAPGNRPVLVKVSRNKKNTSDEKVPSQEQSTSKECISNVAQSCSSRSQSLLSLPATTPCQDILPCVSWLTPLCAPLLGNLNLTLGFRSLHLVTGS